MPGKGRQTKTGSLGDVMQESIEAALTFVRSRSSVPVYLKTFTRKPTYIFMCRKALRKGRSQRRDRDVYRDGLGDHGNSCENRCCHDREITLRGQVLPIGGLKEKLWRRIEAVLSSHYSAMKTKRISPKYLKTSRTIYKSTVLSGWTRFFRALNRMPVPRIADEEDAQAKAVERKGDEEGAASISRH